MENGFFHPDRGYWQAVAGAVEDLLPTYPEGTISVPLKPGPDHQVIDGAWVYVAPVITQQQLLDNLGDVRRAAITGQATISVGERNIPVWVDGESRGAAMGLVLMTQIFPDTETDWLGADGEFYHLDASEIVALALGMGGYVQACFAKHALIKSQIESGVITTFDQIVAAFSA